MINQTKYPVIPSEAEGPCVPRQLVIPSKHEQAQSRSYAVDPYALHTDAYPASNTRASNPFNSTFSE